MVLELDQLLKYQTIALSVSVYCCQSFSSLPLACPPWSLSRTPTRVFRNSLGFNAMRSPRLLFKIQFLFHQG